MDDLIAFLRARLDEDEQVARMAVESLRCGCHPGAFAGAWAKQGDDRVIVDGDVGHSVADASGWGGLEGEVALHVARWDPARVLAEVEAKRRILDEAIRLASYDGEFQFLEMLALPYADHPDYREEWRPAPTT